MAHYEALPDVAFPQGSVASFPEEEGLPGLPRSQHIPPAPAVGKGPATSFPTSQLQSHRNHWGDFL